MLSDRVASHHSASTRSAFVTGAHRCIPVPSCHVLPQASRSWLHASRLSASKADTAVKAEQARASRNGNGNGKVVPTLDGGSIDDSKVITKFIAETLLPTRHGKFRLRGYKHSIDGGITFTEPAAMICGQVEGLENVALRVHDACFTSEVLGSLKCDCAEQLQLTLDMIQAHPPGMVIYLQQEGRGIGLANKIAAYSLQEQGLDTVDANRALGLPDDCREYTSVRNILEELNIKSIQLITNNPRKINHLSALGIKVTGRIPCIVEAGEHNQGYLDAKRDRMDHLLDGSWCFWNHDGEPSQASAGDEFKGGMGLPPAAKVVTTSSGRVLIDAKRTKPTQVVDQSA